MNWLFQTLIALWGRAPRTNATDGRILLFPLDESKPDAESIVRILNELATDFGRAPEVRQFTELAMPASLRNNDLWGQIRACVVFVKAHVVYVADPEGTEYVKSPLQLLTDIFQTGGPGRTLGDCDDHCLLLVAMLRSLGIDARIIGVKSRPDSTWFDHVVTEIASPSGVITVDPCAKMGPPPQYRERLYA